MNKQLKDWTIVEIKAGIFDRQNEIQILNQELQLRANAPVTQQAVEDVPVIDGVSGKTASEVIKESNETKQSRS